MASSILGNASSILLYIRISFICWFRYAWLMLCCAIAWLSSRRLKPTSGTYHKIVMIGDGFAFGYGDYVTMGQTPIGLSRRILIEMSKNKWVGSQAWRVVNKGVYHTTSNDWQPKKELFEKTFASPMIKDCEVVILMVGSMDRRYGKKPYSIASTVANIKFLAGALRRQNKIVIVATLPVKGRSLKEKDLLLKTNVVLEEWLEKVSSKPLDGKGRIIKGPQLHSRKYMSPILYSEDKVHFNSTGYKMVAADFGVILKNVMRQIEWKEWKPRLAEKYSDDSGVPAVQK